MTLLLENIFRGGISSVMGDRYLKSEDKRKILYFDANNIYCCAISKYLPYDENKIGKNVKLENILNTPDNSHTGYFIEVEFKFPDEVEEKTKNFPFAPEEEKD